MKSGKFVIHNTRLDGIQLECKCLMDTDDCLIEWKFCLMVYFMILLGIVISHLTGCKFNLW